MSEDEGWQDWQSHRMLGPTEVALLLSALFRSKAAAGRYLGRSAKTIDRYLTGEANMPPAEVLLLRGLVVFGLRPLVPKRPRR
jgi:hypothetical protein